MPEGPEKSKKSRVITLYNAERAARLALGHWSNLVDRIIRFVVAGAPCAWRSETSPIWQPFGESTLARIIEALTVPSSPAKWIEIQDKNHTILHFDTRDSELAFQIAAEMELLALSQQKGRVWGVFYPGNNTKGKGDSEWRRF